MKKHSFEPYRRMTGAWPDSMSFRFSERLRNAWEMSLHSEELSDKAEISLDPERRSVTWAERFDRRGTEPFELFRSEFGQNSFKIQEFSLENSKCSEIFNINFSKIIIIGEIPTNFIKIWAKSNENNSKILFSNEFLQIFTKKCEKF